MYCLLSSGIKLDSGVVGETTVFSEFCEGDDRERVRSSRGGDVFVSSCISVSRDANDDESMIKGLESRLTNCLKPVGAWITDCGASSESTLFLSAILISNWGRECGFGDVS